jgi:hypothetical protein
MHVPQLFDALARRPHVEIIETSLPERRAGCPISRDLCEKWGFARHPPQRLSEIPTYDIQARSGLKYFYAKDDLHFIHASCYCRDALVGIGYPKFTSSKDKDRVA